MQDLAEFKLIRADNLAPGIFAGTVIGRATTGEAVDFTSDTENGENTRLRLAEALRPVSLSWLSLQHGTDLIVYRQETAMEPKAAGDAALLLQRGLAIAFTAADCLPIIISSDDAVLAIHAGWRGLADGIIESAIQTMLKLCSVNISDLRAWIGPAIDQANYEIDTPVREQLLNRQAIREAAEGENGFTANRPGHWLADLPRMAELILYDLGFTDRHLVNTGLSTYECLDLHSARRDGNASGRMATFAALL
jgi:YfiH family protein